MSKDSNPLSVMQPGEKVLYVCRRHPIGMIGIYIATGVLLVILAVILFGLVPAAFSDNDQATTIGGVAFAILTALSLVFVFISNVIYWDNRLILTSDSITEVVRTSLFKKESSQLSLANLEDITSEKNGILAHMFNFGVLRVETAGEKSKFVFPYCPNPDYCAQQFLAARETFEQGHHGGKQAPYQSQSPSDGRDSGSEIDSYEIPS